MDKIINDSLTDQQFQNFLMMRSVWMGSGRGERQLGVRRQIVTEVLRNAPEGAKQMTVLSVGCLRGVQHAIITVNFELTERHLDFLGQGK